MSDWKQAVANKAEQALEHELVKSVIDELLMNLGHGHDSLPHYGICKVAHYAATVARAQALGIDPDVLVMSAAEVSHQQAELIQAANESGVPVWVIEQESE